MDQAQSVDPKETADSPASGVSESPVEKALRELEAEKNDFLSKTEGVDASGVDEQAVLEQLDAQAAAERAQKVQDEYGEQQPLAEQAPAQEPAETGGDEEQEETAQQQEEEAPEAEAQPGDGDDSEKPPQYRLRPRSELGAKAMALMKSDPTLDEVKAFDMAKVALGISDDQPQNQASQPPPQEKPQLPDLEAAQKMVSELETQLDQALDDFDNDKAKELRVQLKDAMQAEIDAQRAHAQAAEEVRSSEVAAEQARIDQAFSLNEAEAIAAFPMAADPDSKFAKRMAEIDSWHEKHNPDFFNDPEKVTAIAAQVGREMNIAPQIPGAEAPTTPQPSPNSPPKPAQSAPASNRQASPPPMHPARGNASSSPAPAKPDPEAALNAIQTPEQLERWKEANGYA